MTRARRPDPRRTYGHSIEVMGNATRAWLNAGPQHLFVLRYAKRISRSYTKNIDQPATAAQARAFARRYGLTVPVNEASSPPGCATRDGLARFEALRSTPPLLAEVVAPHAI